MSSTMDAKSLMVLGRCASAPRAEGGPIPLLLGSSFIKWGGVLWNWRVGPRAGDVMCQMTSLRQRPEKEGADKRDQDSNQKVRLHLKSEENHFRDKKEFEKEVAI